MRTAAINDLTGGVSPPTCATITNVTLNGVCRLTYAHLAIGSRRRRIALRRRVVVASLSFSTSRDRATRWRTLPPRPCRDAYDRRRCHRTAI